MAIYGEVQVKVTTEELVNKADDVTNKIKKFKTSFEEIKKLMEGTSAYWIGEAGDLHRELYNKQVDDVDEMIKRLEEHPKDLCEIAGVYVSTETANNDIANQLSGDVIS